MRRLIFLAVMIIVVLTNVSGPNLSQAEPLSSARSGTSTPSIIKLTPMKAQAPAYGSAPTRTFYDAVPVPTPDSFIVNKIGPATQPTNMVGAKDNETALWSEPAPSFAPTTLALLKKEVDHYASLAAAGGWPRVPQAVAAGQSGAAVATLRQRLGAEGDLDPTHVASTLWDQELTAAVKKFQGRMGLKQNGQVRGATLTALNIAADVRARQLAATYKRMSAINFAFGDRYIVVNIPSAAVEAVEKGRVAHRYVAVVGDVDHPSPEITARVQAVNLNPTWTVPTSIIKNEIIPKMRKDPAYLKRMKIRIFDSAGKEINPIAINWTGQSAVNYTLRQDSGAGNSLGNIRINMPNTQAVYMHDTPSKKFFGRDYRFLSHGCVRVADVFDFAQWILDGTSTGSKGSTWDKASLRAKADGGERTDIKLASAIPVIWTYMTGWVSEDGIVHFRDDVYGKDNEPAVQALR